jgi:hypothetical protein
VAILPHPGGDVPGFSRLYFHGSEKAGKSIGSLIQASISLQKKKAVQMGSLFYNMDFHGKNCNDSRFLLFQDAETRGLRLFQLN